MIDRLLYDHIDEGLSEFPAVAIYGPRQVGKSTLARSLADGRSSVSFDLENPRHCAMLQDPMTTFEGLEDKLVVIDEAQRNPDLFPVLRVLIDQDRRPGRFLLLGSAAPTLARQASESLAGRIQSFELHPLWLSEIDHEEMYPLWTNGGLPLSFLARSVASSVTWRVEYIRNLVERDMRLLGFDLDPSRIRTFLTMLAHNHGQTWNASQIAKSMGISPNTSIRYLSAMEELFLVRRVIPHFKNIGKRLRKTPKVYFRDSGMLHALLGLSDKLSILEHPICGASWEGFVLQQIMACLPHYGWDVSFWRTSAGAEIDFLIVKGNTPVVGIEVKLNALNPKPRRGFHEGCKDLGIEEKWVVYPGKDDFTIPNDVQVFSLATMINKLNHIFAPTAP